MQAKEAKVKIVAIAKDEAAYLAEWAHHHLYLGFDAIDVYINRTSDNSKKVLCDIHTHFPQVKCFEADWVDFCPAPVTTNIQFIIYAQALAQAREQGIFTHVLFLDIDEFWIHQEFVSIGEYLSSMPKHGAIFFEWLNDLGQDAPFGYLNADIKGNLSPLGKTIIRTDSNILEFRLHAPKFDDSVDYVLADGKQYIAGSLDEQTLAEPLNNLKTAFVYHRATRSEYEYVSTLFRGRPGNELLFKNNRNGMPYETELTQQITLAADAYADYQQSLQEFMSKTNAAEHRHESIAFVKHRYEAALAHISAAIDKDYQTMMQTFHGVKTNQVVQEFTKYRDWRLENYRRKTGKADLASSLAKDAAKQDLTEAIRLMSLAKELRPDGPQINQKLEEYKLLQAGQSIEK